MPRGSSSKRRRAGSNSPPPSKRPRYAGRDQPKKRARKEPKGSFRYKNEDSNKDVPGSDSLREAYYLFLRILWGLKDGEEIPTLPPSDVVAEFNRRYDDNTTRAAPAVATISLTQKAFYDSIPNTRAQGGATSSQIFGNMLKLSDTFYEDLQGACAEEGIAAFRPDFRQSHDSSYNTANYKVAEKIFKQQAEQHVFKHMGVNLSGLKNKRFLGKTYHHFVFHVTRRNWKRELVRPGAAQDTKKTKVRDKRRQRLRDARWKYITILKVPRRVERLIQDPLAHSDDESLMIDVEEQVVSAGTSAIPTGSASRTVTTKKVHVPCAKTLRSARVTKWLKKLDIDAARTKAMTQRRPPSNIVEIERRRSDAPPPTRTHRLPQNPRVPIDWFDPDEFNQLPGAIRRLWADNPRVAFPLDDDLIYQVPPHESMTMLEGPFMEKYGNDVLKLYNIPKPGEVDDDESEDPDAWTSEEEDD